MKGLLIIPALLGIAAVAIGRRTNARRLAGELRKRTHTGSYVEHTHEAISHTHEHPHIVHNRREGADEFLGEWEHLTSLHAHEHWHGALTHAHLAHENAEHEHLGEAHGHRHAEVSELREVL